MIGPALKTIVLFFLFLTNLCSFVLCADNEYVVTLTKDTFDNFINSQSFTIVEFYAPWCTYCKRLAPDYELAAKGLDAHGIKLAKVDVTVEKDLASRFSIQGYPTLKAFRKGVAEEYSGGRTTDTIIQWALHMVGDAMTKVDNVAEIKSQLEKNPFSVYGTFKSEKTEAFKLYSEVAEESRAVGKFYYIVDPEAAEEVVAMRLSEGKTHPVSFKEKEELKTFIKLESLPLFNRIDTSNYNDYFTSGLDIGWFVGSRTDYDAHAQTFREVAIKFRSNITFAWLDIAQFKEHAESTLGVKEFPALVVQRTDARFIYPEKTFTSEKITQFIIDMYDNKYEASLVSEDVPEQSPEDPVYVVVGKTLESVLFSKDRDVFLEAYAPWCGHCKQFEPIYKEFAELQKSNKNVLVAKMDVTKNESPVKSVSWQGIPTIFFVKAGSTEVKVYDGERTVKALTDYLKANGSGESADPSSDEL